MIRSTLATTRLFVAISMLSSIGVTACGGPPVETEGAEDQWGSEQLGTEDSGSGAASSELTGVAPPPAPMPRPTRLVWFVALCNPTDTPTITAGRDLNFYQRLFTDTGKGSVPDYWSSQSSGLRTIASDVVPQWVSTGHTLAWHQEQSRATNIETCVNAALGSGANLNYFNYVAVYNGKVDLGAAVANIQGKQLWAVVMDAYSSETHLLHEMGHGFGLGHSYNDNNVEYGDPYDIMSAMAVHVTKGPYCVTPGAWFACDTGPGLNMASRWQLGWVPRERRQMWWPATRGLPLRTQVVQLAARNEPPGSNPQILYVPASSTSMYTVEWIAADNYDRGDLDTRESPFQSPRIPMDALVIHRVNYGSPTTYLVTTAGGVQTGPGNPYFDKATGVHIELLGGSTAAATVRVVVDDSNDQWAKGTSSASPPMDSAKVNWQGVAPLVGDTFGAGSALAGGDDPGVGTLYPCRAWYGGGVHLGKASASKNWCAFSWGGKEIFAGPGFQVLSLASGVQATWVNGANGSLPAGALAAGFDGGNTLYVCRSLVNGYWTPGKLIWGKCAVPWGGRETFYPSYQVLTIP